jgi:LysM repeat protein
MSMPGMPQVPRIGVMAAALVVAALALFFLPALLGVGGPGDGLSGASPTPTTAPVATSTAAPTARPAPTPQVYVVQSGDTMSRIANRFGVPLDALIEANRETIPNPDRLNIGDQLVIPAPAGSRNPTPAPESPQP